MTYADKITTLTTEQIAEIAEELDIGNRCYVHRLSGKLLFMLDFDDDLFAEELYEEEELYAQDLDELENNSDDYIEIERPLSSDSFKIMENFTKQLEDEKLKNRLIYALDKRKPFRGFMSIIDNSGDFRQYWFDFKQAQLKKWVIFKFNEATNEDNL